MTPRALAAGLMAGTIATLWSALERRLLYFPTRQDLPVAVEAARRVGLEPWTAGGRFLGWRGVRRGAPPPAHVLVLHGNAGTALDRVYLRDVLEAAAPVGVALLEYPGYGPRDGVPSQEALVRACREAVALLHREGAPVVVAGESLGSAVAALAAAELPAAVAGLLLVTPLASVTAVAQRHYPFVPAGMIPDAYRADLALVRYPGPVAFLVAGHDEVVFAELGLALHRERTGPKRLWVEERAGHNDLTYDPTDARWRRSWASSCRGWCPELDGRVVISWARAARPRPPESAPACPRLPRDVAAPPLGPDRLDAVPRGELAAPLLRRLPRARPVHRGRPARRPARHRRAEARGRGEHASVPGGLSRQQRAALGDARHGQVVAGPGAPARVRTATACA